MRWSMTDNAKEKGLISVIVPVYNVEQYLDECVSSIINQTYRNIEIILVDDGSTDDSSSKCDVWAEKDARIRVIHKTNGGLSDACNAGLDICRGEYIGFVDSDDLIEHSMYETMLEALTREGADLCCCGLLVFGDRSEVYHNPKYTVGNASKMLGLVYSDTVFPVCAYSKLYKSSCWSELRFPVGKICEDAFTAYRILDASERIVHIPDPFYHYRIRANSIMTTAFRAQRMDEEEAWRANYEFMRENYPEHRKKSYDFYLQKVNRLIHEIPVASIARYKKEYDYLYGILSKKTAYILFMSELSLKKRLKLCLDILRLPR